MFWCSRVRGTNLLSNLMADLCRMLGVTKLNTTAYHPQCDGAVERFNRTLKTILRKHAAKFGCQWDRFLPGVLWAYRNTPHTSTGEKPSFLLYAELTADLPRRQRFYLRQKFTLWRPVTIGKSLCCHSRQPDS